MEFGIRWEGSTRNITVTRPCPDGKGAVVYIHVSLNNFNNLQGKLQDGAILMVTGI